MSEQPFERWEVQLQRLASAFPYPPTPDLAGPVKQRLSPPARESRLARSPRGLVWAALVVLLMTLAGLLAVPQVRAAVLEFLQIGVIRIFLTEPTPSPPPPTASPGAPPTATPQPTPTPLASILGLAGQTSLAEAQAQLDFSIRLPAYPPDLGAPDEVFLQKLDGLVVVLVWFDPEESGRVRLSLHQLGPGVFGGKGGPELVQETTVHGQPAYWMRGPYLFQLRNGQYEVLRLVEGNVLVWVEAEITYRLETELPLEEAIRVAESLR